MDKSIFTALNSMQILKNNQSVTSQNLSNTNVPGFKKDIHANFGSLYLDREKGIDPRVYALSDVGAFDNSQGTLNPTERPLDLSIDLDLNFNGSTQFASDFNVRSVTQDGQTVGKLDGLDVASNGLVSANYTNGLNIALGRLGTVNFNNQTVQ